MATAKAIAIIDDEIDLVNLFQETLEKDGFKVCAFTAARIRCLKRRPRSASTGPTWRMRWPRSRRNCCAKSARPLPTATTARCARRSATCCWRPPTSAAARTGSPKNCSARPSASSRSASTASKKSPPRPAPTSAPAPSPSSWRCGRGRRGGVIIVFAREHSSTTMWERVASRDCGVTQPTPVNSCMRASHSQRHMEPASSPRGNRML